MGYTKGGAPLGVGAPGPFVVGLCILAKAATPQTLTVPGQHLSLHTVTCRLVSRGIFPSKPVTGSGKTPRPAGTGPSGDSSPPRSWSPTCPDLRLSSPYRTPVQRATWIGYTCQGCQGSIIYRGGHVVVGFNVVQVPAVPDQVNIVGPAPAGRPPLLDAELADE